MHTVRLGLHECGAGGEISMKTKTRFTQASSQHTMWRLSWAADVMYLKQNSQMYSFGHDDTACAQLSIRVFARMEHRACMHSYLRICRGIPGFETEATQLNFLELCWCTCNKIRLGRSACQCLWWKKPVLTANERFSHLGLPRAVSSGTNLGHAQ
jgi:hypothetical protein